LQNNNKQTNWSVDEENIFNEYNHVVNIINDNLKEWQNNCIRVKKRLCGVYTILKNVYIFIYNFWKIVEYFLAMPRTNAEIERIFSITNVLRTDEKNCFLVPTIEAVII